MNNFTLAAKFFCLFGWIGCYYTTWGQEVFRYEKCKENIAKKHYDDAIRCFKRYRFLHTGENLYLDQYVQLYEGFALQQSGECKKAEQKWLQLMEKNSIWKVHDNLRFHLAENYFLQGKLLEGAQYVASIRDEFLKKMGENIQKNYTIQATSLQEVMRLHTQYPSAYTRDKWLSLLIQERLQGKPPPQNPARYGKKMQMPTQLKDKYHIALLLPFGQTNTDYLLDNQAVVDIYRGARMALQEVYEDTGQQIVLHAYDTKGSVEEVLRILSNPSIREVDLMVGPLHQETVEVAAAFSRKEKINMLHPISVNLALGKKNPYFFFAKATYPTQIIKLRDYVMENIMERKVIIFYEDAYKNLIIAQHYAKEVQKAGFELVMLKGFERQDATLLKEELLATIPPEAEEGTRTAEDLAALSFPPYEIGHIFLSASHPLFLANLMSAVEIRPDTIPIFTHEKFLSHGNFSLAKMEKLRVRFLSPLFFVHTDAKRKIVQSYIKNYATRPSTYALIAYETLYAWGGSLRKQAPTCKTPLEWGKRHPEK